MPFLKGKTVVDRNYTDTGLFEELYVCLWNITGRRSFDEFVFNEPIARWTIHLTAQWLGQNTDDWSSAVVNDVVLMLLHMSTE